MSGRRGIGRSSPSGKFAKNRGTPSSNSFFTELVFLKSLGHSPDRKKNGGGVKKSCVWVLVTQHRISTYSVHTAEAVHPSTLGMYSSPSQKAMGFVRSLPWLACVAVLSTLRGCDAKLEILCYTDSADCTGRVREEVKGSSANGCAKVPVPIGMEALTTLRSSGYSCDVSTRMGKVSFYHSSDTCAGNVAKDCPSAIDALMTACKIDIPFGCSQPSVFNEALQIIGKGTCKSLKLDCKGGGRASADESREHALAYGTLENAHAGREDEPVQAAASDSSSPGTWAVVAGGSVVSIGCALLLANYRRPYRASPDTATNHEAAGASVAGAVEMRQNSKHSSSGLMSA